MPLEVRTLAEWEAQGNEIQPFALTAEQLLAVFTTALRDHLDAAARSRRYDDIHTAISYRDDPNPQYAAEGQALFAWRSAVWTYAEAELAKVEAGERDIPTVEAFVAELPPMVWPDAGE